MNARQRRYPLEELARRGKELYAGTIAALVKPDNHGRFVAIDIDTGEFEVGDDSMQACQRLLARLPDAQVWGERIGYRSVRAFGGRNEVVE